MSTGAHPSPTVLHELHVLNRGKRENQYSIHVKEMFCGSLGGGQTKVVTIRASFKRVQP